MVWADEGDEGPSAGETAIALQLKEFKASSGALVPPGADRSQWAHHFTATKGGANLVGAVWFEGDQLVVDAVLETEGQTFIPQRLRLWDPKGRAYGALPPLPPPPAAAPQKAVPSELPAAVNLGLGLSRAVRKRHRHRTYKHEHPKKQSGQYHEGYQKPTSKPEYHEHREPEHRHRRSPVFVPSAGITFTPPPPTRQPLAAMLPPKPTTQHRFPRLPCPRRLKGWSVGGAVAQGSGRPLSLVAVLDEAPGAFVRTAPCQILVVMTFPPGRKGAEATMKEIARAQGLSFVRSVALPSVNTLVALVEVSGPTPLTSVLPGLAAHPRVRYAQPNHLYLTSAYDDPLAGLQYGPKLIRADRAHQVATGRAVPVAIIDTGIDADHPDLQGKVMEEIDLLGPAPRGLSGIHGTLMAGVIGATENNGVGVFGVAPHVRLLGLKACQPVADNPAEAACSSESIARALDIAIRRKVRVINMSLGGPQDRLVEALVQKAARENIVVVAAAGNDGAKAPPHYPAGYETVLAVSAVGLDDKRYEKSNVGDYIDLAAPGVDIVSTVPGERFNLFSGTSLATAHVSAVAALLLQVRPELSVAELTEALGATAKDLGRRGRDPRFGAGRVNACRALERVTGKALCP